MKLSKPTLYSIRDFTSTSTVFIIQHSNCCEGSRTVAWAKQNWVPINLEAGKSVFIPKENPGSAQAAMTLSKKNVTSWCSRIFFDELVIPIFWVEKHVQPSLNDYENDLQLKCVVLEKKISTHEDDHLLTANSAPTERWPNCHTLNVEPCFWQAKKPSFFAAQSFFMFKAQSLLGFKYPVRIEFSCYDSWPECVFYVPKALWLNTLRKRRSNPKTDTTMT